MNDLDPPHSSHGTADFLLAFILTLIPKPWTQFNTNTQNIKLQSKPCILSRFPNNRLTSSIITRYQIRQTSEGIISIRFARFRLCNCYSSPLLISFCISAESLGKSCILSRQMQYSNLLFRSPKLPRGESPRSAVSSLCSISLTPSLIFSNLETLFAIFLHQYVGMSWRS